jgi:hypothetical protein
VLYCLHLINGELLKYYIFKKNKLSRNGEFFFDT